MIGCVGGNPIIAPASEKVDSQTLQVSSNRILWGMWQIAIDPKDNSVEVIPARFSQFHANVRKFLEESPCKNCLKVVPPIIPTDYGMDVNISLTHPFPGHTQYHGFDVRGIVMLEGNYLFPSTNYLTTRISAGGFGLRNADGYTPVFNAVEYTKPGIFGYSHGKMIPLAWGKPANTLNAFKAYYSAGQSEEYGGRRAFNAGDSVQRKYELQLAAGEPFKFWYAVDASWEPPVGTPPYDISDFPLQANCPEAYRFDFTLLSSDLWVSGGSANIAVEIWDHQAWSAPYKITIEAPECSNSTITITDPPISISGEKARWEFVITNELGNLKPSTGTEILVIAENKTDDPFTGPIHGFGRYTLPVAANPNNVIVTSIIPSSGKQGSFIEDAHIKGYNFQAGCNAKLVKSGEPAVKGLNVVFQDSQNLLVDFDLKDAAVGTWDVVVENSPGNSGSLVQGFKVLPPSGCNESIYEKLIGTADFNQGNNLYGFDACFVKDTQYPCDGEFMGYLNVFNTLTTCVTYNVDNLNPQPGHGLGGNEWENAKPGYIAVPISIDVVEKSGRFFIVWDVQKDTVEMWEYSGKVPGQTVVHKGGMVFALDTDEWGGFWCAYYTGYGTSWGIKHYWLPGTEPGTWGEDPQHHITLPDNWGVPTEIICIPNDTLLVLTGSDKGKVRAYDISYGKPPVYKGEIAGIFSGPLDQGPGLPYRMCDMDIDWSESPVAHCRIIVSGNILGGGLELAKIDTEPSILAGPVLVEKSHYESIAINPKTLNVTLWPKRGGSPGEYALIELPPGW